MKINDLDHIWRIMFLFVLVLGIWLYTRAPWLEAIGKDISVAVIAVMTGSRIIAAQTKDNNPS